MQKLKLEKALLDSSSRLEPAFSYRDWLGGYESQPKEYEYWIDEIDGEIPPELFGTFLRNGPGLLDVNGQSLHHPFDGDGMICAISMQNGRAFFRNRFVNTEGYLAEKKAGKILYRGVFGTKKRGGWFANCFDLKHKNLANTNIIYWGGKLLALWEGGEPYSLDPHSLETLGIDDLDGVLKPGEAFAAHPRIEHHSNGNQVLVNFAVKPGLSSTITIYEFNRAGQLYKQHSHTIPGFAFLHDMAITPHYCIFFQNPVMFNPLPYLLGLRSAAQCLEFLPEQPTQIILIPRSPVDSLYKGGATDDIKIIQTDACFVFHHANAWEEDHQVYIDSICYDSFPGLDHKTNFRQTNFDLVPEPQLWRFKVNLPVETVEYQLLERRCCEFPSLNPVKVGKPYRYVYLGTAEAPRGHAPLQGVLKIDLLTGDRQMWYAGQRGFVGEPLFVPRPQATTEDDGWLLTLMYDAAHHRSDFVILDARDLTQEPIARLHLKHHVPYGLHGSFVPEWFGPQL